jgi:hypothetical protein
LDDPIFKIDTARSANRGGLLYGPAISRLNNRIRQTSTGLTRYQPGRYANRFELSIFLEINNQGFDIIYLSEGSLEKPMNTDIDPGQMIRMDNVILPTLGDLQKIGLLGRGGKTETLIWPLTLLERKTK